MKKCLKWIGIGLLVLLVVLVLVLNFALGPIVEKGVAAAGPAAVGVPMSLENAHIRILRGNVNLEQLIVGNPQGYKSDYAFRLGQFKIDMVPRSVLSDTIRIREIVIDSPEIVYEMSLSGSNLGAILDGLEKPEKEPKKDEESAKDEDAKPAKKVQIDRLIVSNGKIKLTSKLMQGKAISLPLPTIELTDIGKKDDEGASIPDVIKQVLKAVITSVTHVVKGSAKLLGNGASAVMDLGTAGAGAALGAAGAGVDAAGAAATHGAEVAGAAATKGAELATDGVKAVGKGAAKGAEAAGDAAAKGAELATDGVKAVGKGAAAVGGAVTDGAGKVLGGLGGLLKKNRKGDEETATEGGAD